MLDIVLVLVWLSLIAIKWVRVKQGRLEFLFWGFVTLFFILDLSEVTVWPYGDLTFYLGGGLALTVLFLNVAKLIKPDDQTLTSLKKELKVLKQDAEWLRQRFIATLDVLPDGLAYKNHHQDYFGTEQFIKTLGLAKQEFDETHFLSSMFLDDIKAYESKIKKTKLNEVYKAKYRYLIDGQYHWIEEQGLTIKIEGKPLQISLVRKLDIKKFPRSSVDVLNNMDTDEAFDQTLAHLHKQQKPYALALIELTNIPFINDTYSRSVGDLMMGEFLDKMRYQFVKEDERLFRLKGTTFAMLLTDDRKIDIFIKTLKENMALLQVPMRFGHIEERLTPSVGMILVKHFNASFMDIKASAYKALEHVLKETTQESYVLVEGVLR